MTIAVCTDPEHYDAHRVAAHVLDAMAQAADHVTAAPAVHPLVPVG